MSKTVSLADREFEMRGRAARLAAEIEDLADRETLTDAEAERLQRQTAAASNLIDEIEQCATNGSPRSASTRTTRRMSSPATALSTITSIFR